MNRISTLLIAVALPVAFAALSAAQEGKTLGTVVDGNTTIEFKAADTSAIRKSSRLGTTSRASIRRSRKISPTSPS
jgi:hypothetical protein